MEEDRKEHFAWSASLCDSVDASPPGASLVITILVSVDVSLVAPFVVSRMVAPLVAPDVGEVTDAMDAD